MTDMSPETLDALKASIAKWERNLEYAKAGRVRDMRIYSDNCPLCQLFYLDEESDLNCKKCPVMKKTKLEYCQGSPWRRVVDAVSYGEGNLIDASQAEVEFLRDLLPKGEQ